jgi:hypothetical protein
VDSLVEVDRVTRLLVAASVGFLAGCVAVREVIATAASESSGLAALGALLFCAESHRRSHVRQESVQDLCGVCK